MNSMLSTYDTIVVGAGPAGSIAAYYLSHARLRVLLLDENKFPREKICGDALTIKTLRFLEEEISVTPKVLENLGGISVRQYRYFKEHKEVEQVFKKGIGLRRFILDDMLRQRAIAAGATMIEKARVAKVTQHNGIFTIYTTTKQVFYSYTLLLACGAHCAPSLKLDKFISNGQFISSKAIGIRSYFRSPLVHNFRDFKFFYLPDIQKGYGWIFPVQSHLLNVGIWTASISRDIKRLFRKFIQEVALFYLPSDAEMVSLPKGALIGINPRISSDIPGLFLAGDAAHAANSLSGEGIYWALQSGKASAAKIIELFGNALVSGKSVQEERPQSERKRSER